MAKQSELQNARYAEDKVIQPLMALSIHLDIADPVRGQNGYNRGAVLDVYSVLDSTYNSAYNLMLNGAFPKELSLLVDRLYDAKGILRLVLDRSSYDSSEHSAVVKEVTGAIEQSTIIKALIDAEGLVDQAYRSE